MISPRLIILRQELQRGNNDALKEFWLEVATQGTPLIEPIAGDPDRSWLTFLWQAKGDLNGVSVISLVTGLSDNKMARMMDTDLWFRTCQVRNDLRATYQLEPDDPRAPRKNGEDMLSRFARYKHDPFNPTTFVFEKDEEDSEPFELIRSVIEMPEAPAHPWIVSQENVSKGRVELHRLRSDILDNERRVWVYTPSGYTTKQNVKCGLVVLFDGLSYADKVPTPIILDNLLASGLVPPMVAVFPDSLGVSTRIRELILHSPFNEFLATELLPWIWENYSVTRNPEKVVVGGASAGGLAAAYAGLEHPELFGNILSQSGAFSFGRPGEEGYEWITHQFAMREKLPLKFYLDAGSLETKSLRDIGDAPNLILSNQNLVSVLQEKGYVVHYHEFSGGHDYISWKGTFPEGLLYLVGTKPGER
ncbi:MAG: alpha/beta hydrolase-fold protein [Candidatus Thorarchaeota archaeon]|jgi:enterochelin esterase family protein